MEVNLKDSAARVEAKTAAALPSVALVGGRPTHRDSLHGDATTATGSVLTIAEVAEYLRVHYVTVYIRVFTGAIPAFKVGSEWRILRSEFLKWIERQTIRVDL